jgi:hypothetical protein
VKILPFLEEGALYQEFHLDEPWDSPQNKKLIERMPKVYQSPLAVAPPGQTYYKVFSGGGAMFGPGQRTRLADITNGTSQTILAVEGGSPVIWTKPDDIPFDPKKTIPDLSLQGRRQINVLMADGAVQNIDLDMIPEKKLKAMINMAGGDDTQGFQGRSGAELAVKVPSSSDPEAKAVADRAINAITKNKPELLAKVRLSVAKANGEIRLSAGPIMTSATRKVEAAWPDRIRVAYEFEDKVSPKQMWGLNDPIGWARPALPNTTPAMLGQYIHTSMLAEHWFPSGLGLGEQGEILYDPRTIKTANGSTTTIKLSRPDRPVYSIAFNDQTGLPIRVEFSYQMPDGKAGNSKVVKILNHMEVEGLRLPARIQIYLNEQPGEVWTVESWTFPESFDDDLFNAPKN